MLLERAGAAAVGEAAHALAGGAAALLSHSAREEESYLGIRARHLNEVEN
jgi:hypothetical protein